MTGIAHHYEYYIKADEVYQALGDFFMERSDRLYAEFERDMRDFEGLCHEEPGP